MKRKPAHTNPEPAPAPETPADALIEEATVEASPTVGEPAEASVQAEVTESSALQVAEPCQAESTESEAAEPSAFPKATEVLPAIGDYLGKVVYGTVYYASYGVVYTALTVARMVPMNNLMGRAIKEGALAASSALKASEEATASQEPRLDDSATLNA